MAKIHFLNVGHGDCTLIEHNDGKLTMIDINNGSDDMDDESVGEIAEVSPAVARSAFYSSEAARWKEGLSILTESQLLKAAGYTIELTNPIAYLKKNYPSQNIFRYIQTHPDFDHLRGLNHLRDEFTVINFWDHEHSKDWDGVEQREGDADSWNAYLDYRAGKHASVLHLHRGSKGKYYNQGEDGTGGGNGLHILSPTPAFRKECDDNEDWNDMSYVIQYITANRRIVFGGDAGDTAWENIYNAHSEKDLKCDVLKASHHGRDSGYHQKSVKAMSPEYTIVSIGKKPDQDASNKYRQYSENVWSTRWKGDIVLEIDGDGAMEWTTSAA
jgi:beta-lactamase superfamily II metal-dependent hydrolase